ncbi:transposase [Legionella waltersii]|uniref:Transposase IS200 like protein n=1 Tax=Legionella waltersii TaxID=66969 RepID=A0A0W1ADK8_9GAMM|nr:transposase [Legionella waltersii]KTD79219.1 Transposase IS200 like protein [Legionella waltersii]SNV12583.1 Transposase and inactivated derivatives [Legionella waltersii]
MTLEAAIPLAYFITFTCYGTWLHGEKPTSVDRLCNTPGTDFLVQNPKRAQLVKVQMSEPPYLLDHKRRNIVLKSIKEVCTYRKWSLFAAHVRSNHVHLVLHAMSKPEIVMNTIKAYASRQLNESPLDISRMNRWTRHGSTRYLWEEEEVEATIHYVVHEQGELMAFYENKDRLVVGDL